MHILQRSIIFKGSSGLLLVTNLVVPGLMTTNPLHRPLLQQPATAVVPLGIAVPPRTVVHIFLYTYNSVHKGTKHPPGLKQ